MPRIPYAPLRNALTHWRTWAVRRNLVMPLALVQKAPLDLRIVGRMLLHAALVGLAAGLCGAAFFAGAEFVQFNVLEELAGYTSLRAAGETFLESNTPTNFRPWLLVILPAVGAGVGGLLSQFAPETRGGGGNAMISAFHLGGARVRLRVIWVRALSAIATLGFGGSGGREGPTMQLGGAIGSAVATFLRMGARERRILYIAGVAAGMAAVFRTPLGAALLAVEVMYRDDFEAEALVPAILASVVAYSVVVSIFGEGTSLFGQVPHFHFWPRHLPLFAALALLVCGVASVFVASLHTAHVWAERLPVAGWARPAVGGLGLGLLATPAVLLLGQFVNAPRGQGVGLLGSGYGEIQLVLTGSPWLPASWGSVQMLALLLVLKLVASCLTIGSGGSAGDFAPSLVLGGLTGGIFGRATALLMPAAHIEPGAFVLVGMAAFYGGIAHAPLASLVMACEMAGSYDLLVPLMLAEGIAFVVLRRRSLYPAQVPSLRDSPVHRDVILSEALSSVRVRELLEDLPSTPMVTFAPQTRAPDMLALAAGAEHQMVFPVEDDGQLLGVVTAEMLRMIASEPDTDIPAIAADLMQTPVRAQADDTLRSVAMALMGSGLRAAVVMDEAGAVVGLLDEMEITRVYVKAAARADAFVAADPP